jgi:diacylglycerol kinase (ATP)
MMPQPHYMVLWNPNARSAQQAGQLRDDLEFRPDVDLHITSSAAEARQLAQQAVASNGCHVVAAGGDGTINAVINGIYRGTARPALGLLPLGTGNDLCRTLKIPLDPFEAADLILNQRGSPRAIDLVRVTSRAGSRMFANVCGGGNSQRVAECLDNDAKRRWGPWSYLRGALEVLRDLEGFDVTLRMDDRLAETMRLWNVIVANGQVAAGGLPIAPQAEVTDGFMDIILVQDGEPLDIASLSMEFFLGDYLEDDRVSFCRARKCVIEASPPLDFAADGEAIATTPVTFEIEERAIRVIRGR